MPTLTAPSFVADRGSQGIQGEARIQFQTILKKQLGKLIDFNFIVKIFLLRRKRI
jgi:hypothetical protein